MRAWPRSPQVTNFNEFEIHSISFMGACIPSGGSVGMHVHTNPLELAGSKCMDIATTQLGDPTVAHLQVVTEIATTAPTGADQLSDVMEAHVA